MRFLLRICLSFFELIANYDTMTERKLKENVDEYFKCRKINTRLW